MTTKKVSTTADELLKLNENREEGDPLRIPTEDGVLELHDPIVIKHELEINSPGTVIVESANVQFDASVPLAAASDPYSTMNDTSGIEKLRNPHFHVQKDGNKLDWQAHFIQPGEDDRIFVHVNDDGSICRCWKCLLSYTRLMIKVCPTTFRSRAFQAEPGGPILTLNDRGNVVCWVSPSVFNSSKAVFGPSPLTEFMRGLSKINPETGQFED